MKQDNRKTIMVEEAVFEDFSDRRKALGLNSTECLQTLLQKEVCRTEITTVQNSMKHRIEGGDLV